jgi:hypothetical protein
VAAGPDGGFVVVWNSDGQDGSALGMFGQRYDERGTSRGGEFQVNTYTTGVQFNLGGSLAVDARGNFTVTFASSEDGSVTGAFARRYTAAGAALGREFQANTFTTGFQSVPVVAATPFGDFMVVWHGPGLDDSYGVFARRYARDGTALGPPFRVNTYTTSFQWFPRVAADDAGRFVVVWESSGQDGDNSGIFGQLYDAGGAPVGGEFQVNTYTTSSQTSVAVAKVPGTGPAAGRFLVVWAHCCPTLPDFKIFARRFAADGTPEGAEFQVAVGIGGQDRPAVAADARGNYVVVWQELVADHEVRGQRLSPAGRRGAEFQANTYVSGSQFGAAVASDAAGNFVATWQSVGQDGSLGGIYAQRFGGLLPTLLAVDATATGTSDGNRVLEPCEEVVVAPGWRNVSGATQTFSGRIDEFLGPAPIAHTITRADATYAPVPDNSVSACGPNCYRVAVGCAATRPVVHWDGTVWESLLPDTQGQMKQWRLHVGESFTDVGRASLFYRFVETLLHAAVTGGCTGAEYCPAASTAREQMAVFVLVAKEGTGYAPPACTSPVFGDVPAASPFCRWIEELARRGVVAGCGGGNFCPSAPVTREQMAVFVLRTLDPALDPPACTAPLYFDVPASSPFCRWIEELTRRGVVAGCGGGNYCPTAAVTREQMAVFVSVTFALTLYGP